MTTGRLNFDQPCPPSFNTEKVNIITLHTAWLLLKAGALRCAVLADTTAFSVLDRPRDTIDGAKDVSIARLKRLGCSNHHLMGPWQISGMSPIHDWRCMHCAYISFLEYVMFRKFYAASYVLSTNIVSTHHVQCFLHHVSRVPLVSEDHSSSSSSISICAYLQK